MLEINTVQTKLDEAFQKAIEVRDTLFYATEDFEKAKLIKEQRYSLLLFNNEIEGKNVEQRQAHAQVLMVDEIAQENESAEVLRRVKFDYDTAMLEVSRWKAILRTLEVIAQLESLD
jgi:hypothetical protein